MIKRLLFLCVIVSSLALIGAGERTSVMSGTITDSISVADTADEAIRADTGFFGPFYLNGYETFQYVWFAQVQDTNFTDDSTFLRFQGGLLVNQDTVWSTVADTLVTHLTSDTTAVSLLYGLDSLGWDIGRLLVVVRDSNDATAPGLLGNTYDHVITIAFRRTR